MTVAASRGVAERLVVERQQGEELAQVGGEHRSVLRHIGIHEDHRRLVEPASIAQPESVKRLRDIDAEYQEARGQVLAPAKARLQRLGAAVEQHEGAAK